MAGNRRPRQQGKGSGCLLQLGGGGSLDLDRVHIARRVEVRIVDAYNCRALTLLG